MLKTHNCPVYVLGDYNGNHRLLDDRQNNDSGEQLIELMEITFHHQQGSGTSDKVMGYTKLENTERSRNRNRPYPYNVYIINKSNQN